MIPRAANYFGISSGEFLSALSLGILLVVFKILNLLHHQFDSDEAQYLHVIWGWTHGYAPYREIFDNHMPLFQLIFAPIFALVGERATALFWMRAAILPMYFVAAWCTYRIGELIFSRRAGLWAVLLAGFYQQYHFRTLEFRTDNLWAPLWLLCLMVLLSGRFSMQRALSAGLILGLCFGISLKSTIFFLVFLASAVALLIFSRRDLPAFSKTESARHAIAFVIAMLIAPVTIAIFFAARGLWPDFLYCVFTHNIFPNLDPHSRWNIFIFPLAFPFVLYAARWAARLTDEPRLRARRIFAVLVTGFYQPLLYSFWVLITRQDFLPFYPLAFVFTCGLLFGMAEQRAQFGAAFARFFRPAGLTAVIALSEFVFAIVTRPFWENGAKIEIDLVRDVLTLTEPRDFVFDCKGETILRPRCTRLVFEKITRERIARELMADDVPQRCIETRTCVATVNAHITEKAGAFVRENYLPVTPLLRVVGMKLATAPSSSSETNFDVVIPAMYQIIAPDMQVTGELDGAPYDGARFLNAGPHRFRQTSNARELVLLWSRAVDRHYLPFDVTPLTLH